MNGSFEAPSLVGVPFPRPRPTSEPPIRADEAALARRFARLRVQNFVGRLTLLPFCGLLTLVLKYWLGYRVENLAEVRRRFAALLAEADTRDEPLVICSNHLTYADSAIINVALVPVWRYVYRYRHLSWNLPAADYFSRPLFRVTGYLTKCIFIHRGGTKEHKDEVLETARRLLLRGDIVTIFPEGRRSRSARFERERLVHGVGKLVTHLPRARVLCLYLRADGQEGHSSLAPKGSRFRIRMELLRPAPRPEAGREAYAEVVNAIGDSIARMEAEHFRERGRGWN